MKSVILIVKAENVVYNLKGLRVIFDIKKSIGGGANSANIKVYNVSENLVQIFSKDFDDARKLDITLQIKNDNKISNIFHGAVFKGISARSGADIETDFDAFDGLEAVTTDFIGNSNTKYTAFLKLCQKAGLTVGINHFNNSLQKIAHHGQILSQLIKLDPSRIFFIENKTAHYLEKSKGTVVGFSPLISKNQLVNMTNKSDGFITFETLQNDYIQLGGLVLLEGLFGGSLRAESIDIRGDSFGDFFKQQIKCRYMGDFGF